MWDERAGSTLRMGDYRRILRRYWLPVVLCLVLGTGAALTYLTWAPLQYRAQTSVLVTPTVTRTTNSTARAEAVNMDTEAQLVTATATVSAAADELHLPPDRVGDLADRVDVTVPPNTDVLDISFTGNTAEEAQEAHEPSRRHTWLCDSKAPRPRSTPSPKPCRPASTHSTRNCRTCSRRPPRCPPSPPNWPVATIRRRSSTLNSPLLPISRTAFSPSTTPRAASSPSRRCRRPPAAPAGSSRCWSASCSASWPG